MPVNVKICGLSTGETVQAAVEHGASFIGFVFFPKSPRAVTPVQAAALAQYKKQARTVAVTVDPSNDEIRAMVEYFSPDYLQLHGKEMPARVQEIKDRFQLKCIKAISVRNADDIARAGQFSRVADMLMFDAKAPSADFPGGTGLSFDWTLLKGREFSLPWLLAGGIGLHNLEEAASATGARYLDLSSSLEQSPGIKDPKLIREFLEKAKQL